MCRVLLVEDDEDIRTTLAELLAEDGFSVSAVANGREALAYLESASPLPCVVLLDRIMPVMDGRAFREEQLRRARIASIPVVVLSASGDIESDAASMKAAGFLRKPLRLEDITGLLGKLCPPAGAPTQPR